MEDRMLPRGDVAKWLDVTERTLARWENTKYGPPVYRIGREKKYLPSEVRAWLDGQRQSA